MHTLIQLLDICRWCFLFHHFFHLCQNSCGPVKTALLLWACWAERDCRTEGVIVDVSLGGELWFRTLSIKSTSKWFYYPERYVRTDKTRYWTLINNNFINLISTGQSFKPWIIRITLSTSYVKFDCFWAQAPTSAAFRGGHEYFIIR